MIPLLGVFRILAIVIFGMFALVLTAHFNVFSNGHEQTLKSLSLTYFLSPVLTDFGFAFYRRFVNDDTGMNV